MVRCGDCKFLALGNRFTSRLDEAGAEYRATGEAPFVKSRRIPGSIRSFHPPYEYPYTNIPACAIGVRDLAAAFADDALGEPPKILCYLRQKRDCLGFVKWRDEVAAEVPGAGPPWPLPSLARAILKAIRGNQPWTKPACTPERPCPAAIEHLDH